MTTIATEKIHCANCTYCTIVQKTDGELDKYVLRVRCAKGKWSKRSGEEKLYKYFTVARRTQINCEDYRPMGPLLPYLKNLKRELPIKDEVYTHKHPPANTK